MQHMLGALGGPQRQKLVVRVAEQPAPADRDQARVADAREDHANSLPVLDAAACSSRPERSTGGDMARPMIPNITP
jgi:hypothetical protein